MINSSQQIDNTNSTSIIQEIDADIQKALDLLDDAKKQDSKNSIKELETFLIDYILANMKGDHTGAQAIQAQIAQVMQQYGKDMQQANELAGKLKAMEANPGSNPSNDLTYLQSLLSALQKDAESGDMSNLYQY